MEFLEFNVQFNWSLMSQVKFQWSLTEVMWSHVKWLWYHVWCYVRINLFVIVISGSSLLH